MQWKKSWWGLLSSAVLVMSHHSGSVWATSANGRFQSKTLYVGRFGEIDVSNHFSEPMAARSARQGKLWISRQSTKGTSELYVQGNTWQRGGTTGWHTHAGHSLVIVTKGAVTAYDGDDSACTPHVYTVGMGFVDRGGGHVHLIRNESGDDAETVSVQLIPAGQPRRIDARDPGNCHF